MVEEAINMGNTRREPIALIINDLSFLLTPNGINHGPTTWRSMTLPTS